VLDRRQILTGGGAIFGAGALTSIHGASDAAGAVAAQPAQGARRSDAIRAENAKAGSTDWLLTRTRRGYHETYGRGWDVRAGIQGFASHMSIKAGETLRLYVSAEPADEYRLDIYRMGYYGGAGGRLVRTFGRLKGTPQPMPKDGEHAIFQCSDFTWQSYNRWPQWRSMYDGPKGPWVSRQLDSYSARFDRPYAIYWNGFPAGFEAQSNGSGEFLLWELPLAFWLEKEGYDVTYTSNLDTHEDARGCCGAGSFCQSATTSTGRLRCTTTSAPHGMPVCISRFSPATRCRDGSRS
jgi:hypothetical protein